jgi:salicylate hydroxylase
LRKIPPERLHPSKKLVSIIEPQDENTPYALHFEDGDTYHADAVIGCDGIHSKVRQFVLDSTCPALCGGYWNTAGKLPRQQALARFGPDLLSPSDPKEVALIGEGASVLFVPTENGEVYHVIVAGMADPEQHPSSWKMAVERSYLETALRQWDVKMREALVETLVPSPNGTCTILSHFESSDTPSYIRNRACIIGDAAHATIPWLGQGACMATEDAAVLSSLLGLADSTTALKIALKSFDATRRGRPELVMSLSHQAAMILTGQRGLNPESIEQFHAPQWWSEFWSLDADAHIQVAVDRFHQLSAQIA